MMRNDGQDVSRRTVMAAGGLGALAMTADRSGAATPGAPPVAELFVTTTGIATGRNVMFLHGWTCDSHDWSWQYPLFESRYRVVAPDLRGHGRSQVMPSGQYKPADYVADVEALMVRASAGRPFVLVGHSMGGQIAALLAAKRPDLVSAVVSVDGAFGFDEATAQAFAKVVRDMDAGDPGQVVPALFELVYGSKTEAPFKRWHARRVQGDPVVAVRESFAPLFFGPGQVGVGEASARLCRSIKAPVYHLCRDPAQADRMRPWFGNPKSKVDVWPDAGHWIMQDQPAEVNAAISGWIDRL